MLTQEATGFKQPRGLNLQMSAKKISSSTGARRKEPTRAHAGFEQVFEKIYRLVLRIPSGRVMTYGQIARLLEDRFSPRLVGWAMHATPKDGREIPWHRVVNSRGGISTGRLHIQQPDLQRLLLEAEGVVFNKGGYCDLQVFQWSPTRKSRLSTSVKAASARKKARPDRERSRKRPTQSAKSKIKRKTRNGNNF